MPFPIFPYYDGKHGVVSPNEISIIIAAGYSPYKTPHTVIINV